ncbi:Caleosin related protein-domain-containing protein [Pilobolus umbonatus]|nr:Caleosin related protein-domain-containing protein [Pilobolus umbonatus]
MDKTASVKTSEYHKDSDKTEEFPIQKHVKFWDKNDKGLITPYDCVLGFTELGYTTFFSILLGTAVSIMLSVFSRQGLFPDPLLRASTDRLIESKKRKLAGHGAYDEYGVFMPEKYDALYGKYAGSNNTGGTITIQELMKMTQEQENANTWFYTGFEVLVLYLFIGHHGVFKKQDVQSAYDGTLFYSLKKKHEYEDTVKRSGNPTIASNLMKAEDTPIQKLVQSTYRKLQDNSYVFIDRYNLNDWVDYMQHNLKSLKETGMSRLSRSTSMIAGVTAPKPTPMSLNDKGTTEVDTLFPNGLTGVSKEEPPVLCGVLQESSSSVVGISDDLVKSVPPKETITQQDESSMSNQCKGIFIFYFETSRITNQIYTCSTTIRILSSQCHYTYFQARNGRWMGQWSLSKCENSRPG